MRKVQPVIKWKPVPGATRYGIYISRPQNGDRSVVFKKEDITGAVTNIAIPIDMEDGVTYEWTIRAGNERGWGPLAPYKKLSA
ncbi:MAG: hypothetical protein FJ317_08380 [SAR202 cluster bacterium]|nr:hypothetical protein [SAR202 cluster bacterium]